MHGIGATLRSAAMRLELYRNRTLRRAKNGFFARKCVPSTCPYGAYDLCVARVVQRAGPWARVKRSIQGHLRNIILAVDVWSSGKKLWDCAAKVDQVPLHAGIRTPLQTGS